MFFPQTKDSFKVFASVYSLLDNSGALAVFDIDKGVCDCVYIHEFEDKLIKKNFRGVAWHREKIYAVSNAGLYIFSFRNNENQAPFHLDQHIVRPEWLLGEKNQGNLCAMHASSIRERLYISYSALDAVDIFTLEGDFRKRIHLWDISPGIERLLKYPHAAGFGYGFINHIFEDGAGNLFLTLSAGFDREMGGAIVDIDSGEIILQSPDRLHGGFVCDNFLYVCAIRKAIVYSFSLDNGLLKTISDGPVRTYCPIITNPQWQGSIQRTRGILVRGNEVICGIMDFRKPNPKQAPPRIVVFDRESGEQLKEIFLPEIRGLRWPCIYSLREVPQSWLEYLPPHQKPRFYHGTNEILEPKAEEDSVSHEEWAAQKLSPDKQHVSSPSNDDKKNSHQRQQVYVIENKRSLDSMATYNANKGLDKENTEIYSPFSSMLTEQEARQAKKVVVELKNVRLCFQRKGRFFFSRKLGLNKTPKFWALQDISFRIHEGETVGIIGRNGSGKSTTALLLAGIYKPDDGTVKVNGEVNLLALGTGFKPELTGRENIYVNGGYLGFSRKYVKENIDKIIEFAELGDFIDEPVRTYSSGMRSRLTFSIATVMEPEIMVIDEVMAAGDQAFKAKAERRIQEMTTAAKTVIIISHQPALVRRICKRVIWLENGRIVMDGRAKTVLKSYADYCKAPQKWIEMHGG